MPQEYITKDRAAKLSGRSIRRLLELAAQGRIRKKIIRDQKHGNRELAVFHAGDISELAKGRIPEVGTMPVWKPAATNHVALPQPEAPAEKSTAPPRLFLTVAEAAQYSGLPASFLRQIIVEKKLLALDVGPRPGGRWRIAKRDIDAIIVNHEGKIAFMMQAKA